MLYHSVVLMDELDQLVTPSQDVIYNFFNWPTMPSSKLVVLAVANTMDLPERVMSGKVRSRLGMERVDFRPYKRDQLEDIVWGRLSSVRAKGKGKEDRDDDVMDKDAVRLAAARVAAVSGDARRVLDVCRYETLRQSLLAIAIAYAFYRLLSAVLLSSLTLRLPPPQRALRSRFL